MRSISIRSRFGVLAGNLSRYGGQVYEGNLYEALPAALQGSRRYSGG